MPRPRGLLVRVITDFVFKMSGWFLVGWGVKGQSKRLAEQWVTESPLPEGGPSWK